MNKYKIINNALENPCESCKKQEGQKTFYGILCDECCRKLLKANQNHMAKEDKYEVDIGDVYTYEIKVKFDDFYHVK